MKSVVSGVLLLDKPSGVSSHSAVSRAKVLFRSDVFDSKKAGHTGTLDPLATGLLPICFGEATKLSQYGLDADKGYTALLQLGVRTDTGDAAGQVVQTTAVAKFDERDLARVASAFVGQIWQTPPMYSALKKDGKKLYEYARLGMEIERTARPIVIQSLKLTKVDGHTIAMTVLCSKGTYVRTLGEDVANALGTVGHLVALHRTHTGGFVATDAIGLDELIDLPFEKRFARLLPADVLVRHLPMVAVSDDERVRLQLGQRLNIKERAVATFGQCHAQQKNPSLETDQHSISVRLYADDRFVGLGLLEPSGRLQPKKCLNFNL